MTLVFAGLPSACVFAPSARAFAPNSRPFPSGRYTHTNPLRREAGLRLLGESLPEPLRWSVLRRWRGSSRYSETPLDVPTQPLTRPDDATLLRTSPESLGYAALIEFELARRVVEAPKDHMLPVTRNAMLSERGMYLRKLYDTLARKMGEAYALAEFERLLSSLK